MVVECDGGGEREEACADAGAQAVEGARAVAFEREDVFAGAKDRLDALADRREVGASSVLVFAPRAGDRGVQICGGGLEVAAGVALVADDGQVSVTVDAFKQAQADVALADLGAGERERARRAVGGEEAVEAKAPEVAAVAGGVAVIGGVGELAAPGCLDRAGALHRGSVR